MKVHGNFKDAKNKGNCVNCGVYFESYDSKKYCSLDCYKFLRKKTSIKYNHKCMDCDAITDFRNKRCRNCFGISQRGKKLSEHQKQILAALPKRIGSLSNFWRNGRSGLDRLIRNCVLNSNWRKSVFARDNYTCQTCSKRGGYLEADHINPFKNILDDFLKIYNQFSVIEDKETLFRLSSNYEPFWDVNNGRTLCKECHLKTPTHGRRKCAF